MTEILIVENTILITKCLYQRKMALKEAMGCALKINYQV